MKLAQNPYTQAAEILGVRKLATEAEIRAAWRQKAFETHPDRPSGSAESFNRVNEAYELLKTQGTGKRWMPDCEPTYSRQEAEQKWSRPRVKTNIVEITTDLAALCKSSLDRAAEPANEDHHHIPETMRQKGRQVSYIVRSTLKKGANRVSLPKSGLFGRAKGGDDAEVINLNAVTDGRATIEVPEKVRSSKFPGASSVRIHFATA